MTIKNSSLKKLLHSVANWYWKACSALPVTQQQQQTVILNRNEAITNPAYAAALAAIECDQTIKGHCDQLVGTAGERRNMSSHDYLEAFLVWQHRRNSDFDQAVFDTCYKEFEDFFFNDYLDILSVSKLYNFEMTVDSVDLGPNVRIRRLTADESNIFCTGKVTSSYFHSYSNISQSKFVVEVKTSRKKIVQSATAQEGNLSDKHFFQQHEIDTQIVVDLLERAVILLRLLKSSSVYMDHRTIQRCDGFCLQTNVSSMFTENTVVGEKCTISDLEIEELKTLWENFDVDDLRMRLGITRLSSLVERKNVQDKMLDVFIAFEALYLPDGNNELTFRLSLRIAMIHGRTSEEAKDLFKFLRNMYSVRSSVVHGKKSKVGPADLLRLENLMRAGVKNYLMDRDQFSADRLNDVFFRSFPS